MASFVGQLFCYFFILLISSSLIHARESRFFSKLTHFSTTQTNVKETKLAPVEAPAAVEALAPAPEPTTFTTQNRLSDEEFEGGNYEKEYQSSNYNNNAYTNNNNGYTGNYNYNGYQLSSESESHETANQNNYNSPYTTSNYNNNGYELASGSYETSNQNDKNRYTTNNYNNNNGYINNYNTNGYEADQRQGMSDTRFMQGGKYYYDVQKENYYYPANGYANQVSNRNTNTNEFSTMDDQNGELYDENQEESLP